MRIMCEGNVIVQKLVLTALCGIYIFLTELLREFNLLFNLCIEFYELQMCGYNLFVG